MYYKLHKTLQKRLIMGPNRKPPHPPNFPHKTLQKMLIRGQNKKPHDPPNCPDICSDKPWRLSIFFFFCFCCFKSVHIWLNKMNFYINNLLFPRGKGCMPALSPTSYGYNILFINKMQSTTTTLTPQVHLKGQFKSPFQGCPHER